jgi:tetratricopeptide (TPR) repeat protein
MTVKEINNAYRRIVDMLDDGVLKTAFEWIQTLVSGAQLFSFQEKVDELQETYRYMLCYYADGSEDPMQKQIYARIRIETYELADRIRYRALLEESQTIYFTYARTQTGSPAEIGALLDKLQEQYDLEDLAGYEMSGDRLFMRLWTEPFLAEDGAASVSRALKSAALPFPAKCLTVSALLLGMQACFDLKKLYLLFDAAEQDDEEIRIRAFIAICLTLNTYSRRTAYYPGIRHRLDILAEAPEFKRILLTVALRFILARETERVSFMMRDEIIPELIDFAVKSRPGGPDTTDMFQNSGDDMNPEWFDALANSSLAKKIEEYSHLQEEGVDVMHSTFVDLKHFPFFRTVSNWFLPFMPTHSLLVSQSAVKPVTIDILNRAPFMCNSDKYSMFFSLSQIPERQRLIVAMQMDSQFDAMTRQYGEALKSRQNKVERITGQYVQDLFRFYKLFVRRREFDDVFKGAPEFHSLPILKQYFSDPETLLSIAELYLRKKYPENAQALYEQLLAHYPDDATIYQKLGYCKQMRGDTAGALEDYLRSEIMNPDSKWLIRRIGSCYKALKQPEKALEFFRRYEKMTPGNTQALILAGHCYMDMQDYAEALKYYFKADYMERENVRAWRAIAWCSFLSKKYDQARNYYGKILECDPQTQDYLNAGHAEWAQGQTKNAFEYYLEAIRREDGEFEKFLTLFNRDVPDLIAAGVDPSEIPLMLDWLRYTA